MIQGASQKNNQSPETKYEIYEKSGIKTRYPGIVRKTGSVDTRELQYKAKEKEWYIFVNSYLVLSRIGCEHLLHEEKLTISKKYITIAIIYNLKHKGTDKNDKVHDIKELFRELKKTISKGSKKEAGKLSKSSMNNLETMITKYQELSLLNRYIQGCFTMNDTKNTFLKYPENSTQIVVNYEKMLSQVTKNDIKGIKTDIDKLIKIMPNIKKIIG